MIVAPAAERAGFAGYRFGLSDEEVEIDPQPAGRPAGDRHAAAAHPFRVSLEKVPQATRPLEARVTVRLAEAGGRAVERKLTLPVTAAGPMIGVRPLFSGRSLGEGEQATFDVVVVGPDGAALTRSGLRYELLRVETRYQWYRRDNTWDFEPVKLTRRIADGQLNVAAGTPARLSLPVQWGRYRLGDLDRRARRSGDLDRLRRRLVHRSDRRYARHARGRARQAGIRARRQHDGRGHGAHRRQGHARASSASGC